MSASMHGTGLANLSFVVGSFLTAFAPKDEPALGKAETLDWEKLTRVCTSRRVGKKDGPNLVLARLKPEPDGQVRRLKENVQARTVIAMDIETNKKTGEVPLPFENVLATITQHGFAAIMFTTHNHTDAAPRYRILLPLSAEIPAQLPAVEAVAEILGVSGVLDSGKLGAASLFYLPSANRGEEDKHRQIQVAGAAVDADWIQDQAQAILADRERVQAEIRAAAMAESERRRAKKIAAGLKPTDKLIEGIRDRLT